MTVEAAVTLAALVPVLFLGLIIEMRFGEVNPNLSPMRKKFSRGAGIVSATGFTLAAITLEVQLLTIINDGGWNAHASFAWINAALACGAFVFMFLLAAWDRSSAGNK